MSRRPLFLPLIAVLPALLGGCDQLGIESPAAASAHREAEGKAIGAACRHAGRAIEDCYLLNKKADKAAVFAGWREMNDYMRENNIEVVQPKGLPTAAEVAEQAPPAEEPAARGDKAPAHGEKPAAKKGA